MAASNLAMSTAELFSAFVCHLDRDVPTLIALSSVSKRTRALTLPHLVRHLDVCVSKANLLQRFLESVPPPLLDEIEYVRVREDEVYTRFQYRPHSEPTAHVLPEDPTFWKWEKHVLKLLLLISRRSKKPLPRLDMSIAFSDMTYVNQILRENSGMPVSAFRLLVDLDRADYEDGRYEFDEDKWVAMRETFFLNWSIARGVIKRVAKPDLKTFSFDNSGTVNFGDNVVRSLRVPPEAWTLMAGTLRDRAHLKDLNFAFSRVDVLTEETEGIFFRGWDHLRKLRVHFPNSRDEHEAFSVHVLLWAETQLEDVSIVFDKDSGQLSYEYRFPNLRAFQVPRNLVVSAEELNLDLVPKFGAAHLTMQDWNLAGVPFVHARHFFDHEKRKELLAAMRIIRGSVAVVKHVIQGGGKPAHLQFDPVPDIDALRFWQWLTCKAARKAAEAITCLDIELDEEPLADLIPQLGHFFSLDAFPKLQELILCTTTPCKSAVSVEESLAQLRSILLALRPARSLRALRIEHMGAAYFPPGDLDKTILSKCPSHLEYISWHVPTRNTAQYYRVVRASKGVVLRYQRLPPSFRVRIDQDGVWQQEPDLRRAAVLLDHTGEGKPSLRLF